VGLGAEGRHGGRGLRHRRCVMVGRRGQGEESGVGRPGAGGQASGIWGRGIEGGGSGVEVGSGGTEVGSGIEGGDTEEGGGIEGGSVEGGGGVEGGDNSAEVGGGIEGGGVEGGGGEVVQPDGAKQNFTMIRVSHGRGYSRYTRYIFGIY
jgi:hypothetical protein